jgi:hypothetical protein
MDAAEVDLARRPASVADAATWLREQVSPTPAEEALLKGLPIILGEKGVSKADARVVARALGVRQWDGPACRPVSDIVAEFPARFLEKVQNLYSTTQQRLALADAAAWLRALPRPTPAERALLQTLPVILGEEAATRKKARVVAGILEVPQMSALADMIAEFPARLIASVGKMFGRSNRVVVPGTDWRTCGSLPGPRSTVFFFCVKS